MRAGDGNPVLQPHQFRQHFHSRYYGDMQLVRLQDLDVVGMHGRGGDHDVRVPDIRTVVADAYCAAKSCEPVGLRTSFKVRARNLVSEVEEELRYAAHSYASDTHKMNLLYFSEHNS